MKSLSAEERWKRIWETKDINRMQTLAKYIFYYTFWSAVAGLSARGRLDLISILALLLVFHAITLERSGFKENPTNFSTSVAH